MSERDRFAGLANQWLLNEDLTPPDREFVVDYLLRYLRGNQIVINSLPDVLEWGFNGDNVIFNQGGLTIPMANLYVDGYLIPTLENDSVTNIRAIEVIGTKAYIGGTASKLGGLTGSNLYCLDLSTGIWSVPAVVTGNIWALATDGTDLYIGTDGNGSTPYAMKLSGGSLTTLGTDLDGVVNVIYYDSTNDNMHFGGAFTNEGNYYAIWDVSGSSWSTVGTGFSWSGGGTGGVYGITGDGTSYYFVGKIDDAGGITVANAAKLTGSTYTTLGTLDGYGLDIVIYNDTLYSGGLFTGKIARYTTDWEVVGAGLSGTVQDLLVVGDTLYLNGANGAYKFKDGILEKLGTGTSGGTVNGFALSSYSDSIILVGGDYTTAGGKDAKGLSIFFLNLGAVLDYLPSFSVTEASQLNFEPAGELASTDTQAAIEELDTEATKDADTDVSGNAWVLDEDNFASNDDTKVPTQQSAKAFVVGSSSDTQIPVNVDDILTGSDNLRFDPDTGNLFLGDGLTVAEAAALGVTSSIFMSGNGITRSIRQFVFGSNSPRIRSYYAKGTKASPTLPVQNNSLYERIVSEYLGSGSISTITNWSDVAIMRAVATEDHTTTAKGTKWEWTITPNTSTTQQLGGSLSENGITLPERSTDAATPETGEWTIYPKSGGIYIVDDAGSVTGPIGTGGAWDGDITDIDKTSSSDIGADIADDDQGIIYDTSATAWVRFAWSRVKTYIQALTDTLYPPKNGWIDAPALTYVSAYVCTASGDYTDTFVKGTRVKLTQTTDKYFPVYSSSYSGGSGLTTITFFTQDDFILANAAITSPYYSYLTSPPGWPGLFEYSPTISGYSSDPTSAVYKFKVEGNFVKVVANEGGFGTINATTITYTAPCTSAQAGVGVFPFPYTDGNYQAAGGCKVEASSNVITFYRSQLANWVAGMGNVNAFSIEYEF